VASKRAGLLVIRGGRRLGNGQLLQMLEMTVIGSHSHVSSQALDEVCHRLADVFLWQLFPDGLQGSFQLISRLRLWLQFMVLFQHDSPDVLVQLVQIRRVSMNPGHFACSQFCMKLER